MSGFWLLIFLGRWSMVLGWRDLIKTKVLQRRHEFVSADARNFTNDARTYEMLDSAKTTPALNISSPDRVLSPEQGQAHPLRSSPMTPEPDVKEESYFDPKFSARVRDNNSPQTPAPAYTFPSPSPSSPGIFSPREWDYRTNQTSSLYGPGTAIFKDHT